MRTSLTHWRVAGFVPNDAAYQNVASNPHLRPAHDWVPATVPGHVQSDLVDAGVIGDPFLDRQSEAAEWTSAREWVYETTFEARPGPARLCFGGVDHDCEVFLNGERLGEHHGMFGFSFEVELQASNQLRVLVLPAVDSQDELGDTSLVRTWKARFAYWWDFSARLVPLGIWQDVWIEDLDGLGEVQVHADADGAVHIGARTGTEVTVLDPEGRVVARGGPGTLHVESPRLWWPNGYGDQPLYTVRCDYGDESATRRVGFRTLTINDFQVAVNGREIPTLGWNWVPVHQLYGREHAPAYRSLLRRVKAAGATMLRVWGGGILEREQFYDLCDEAGILVWQDLLQSSSARNCEPAVDEDYLEHCRTQAVQMVRARRHHACLALWSAGNELATGPERKPLTDDHPNAVALREVVEAHDPGRPWLVTTPTGEVPFAKPGVPGHNVHGSYWHLGLTEHEDFYAGLECRFQGEVGCHGAANIQTLRRTMTTPWPRSQGWVHKGAWWQNWAALDAAFGPIDDLEKFVAASQWLQAHGLRAIVEQARGRAPDQTGVLLWQLNEPWPNSACSSVIDVYGHPKPGYWAVAEAFRAPADPEGGAITWYDAQSGAVLEGPVDGGLCVREQDGRQELLHGGGEHPLRTLLDVPVRMHVSVEGTSITITAEGGPLHGVFVQTVDDHDGPYVEDGWRWFVACDQSWSTRADRLGKLMVSALNAPPCVIDLSVESSAR